MKRKLLSIVVFLCLQTTLFSQDKDVCEKKMEQVEDIYSIDDVNKCLIDKSSVKKDDKSVKERVTNQLRMKVFTHKKSGKNIMRYSTLRKKSTRRKYQKLKNDALTNVKGVTDKLESSLVPDEILFVLVDEVPIFEKCGDDTSVKCFNQELQKHFFEHFSYPKEAIKQNMQGRVFVKFVIDKKGKVQNVKTYSSGNKELLEKEVERIMLQLPVFTPGRELGKKINVIYSMPIDFKLK